MATERGDWKATAEVLRGRRLAARIPQKTVATAAGVHRSWVTKIESGGYNVPSNAIDAYAKVLGVDVAELKAEIATRLLSEDGDNPVAELLCRVKVSISDETVSASIRVEVAALQDCDEVCLGLLGGSWVGGRVHGPLAAGFMNEQTDELVPASLLWLRRDMRAGDHEVYDLYLITKQPSRHCLFFPIKTARIRCLQLSVENDSGEEVNPSVVRVQMDYLAFAGRFQEAAAGQRLASGEEIELINLELGNYYGVMW